MNDEYVLVAYIVGVVTTLFGLLLLESRVCERIKMTMIAVGVAVAVVATVLHEM